MQNIYKNCKQIVVHLLLVCKIMKNNGGSPILFKGGILPPLTVLSRTDHIMRISIKFILSSYCGQNLWQHNIVIVLCYSF